MKRVSGIGERKSPMRSLIGALLLVPSLLCAQGANPANDGWIARLRDGDMEVRIGALRELQTSLDPRLPEAFLPLLGDEGNSIRRLAARGVGSRYWQIPPNRIPVFLETLARNLVGEREDERNMTARAIGLLTEKFDGPMFGKSPAGRWVIYERYGLPCLIDKRDKTEELLGWEHSGSYDGKLASAWGNCTVERSVHWHPTEDIVALDIIIGRKDSTVWVWRHRKGIKKFESHALRELVGYRDEEINGGAGFYADTEAWHGNELRLSVDFGLKRGDKFFDVRAVFGWDMATDALRLISKQEREDV